MKYALLVILFLVTPLYYYPYLRFKIIGKPTKQDMIDLETFRPNYYQNLLNAVNFNLIGDEFTNADTLWMIFNITDVRMIREYSIKYGIKWNSFLPNDFYGYLRKNFTPEAKQLLIATNYELYKEIYF